MKTLLRSRVLAWVLTLAMVVTFMPTMAFAASATIPVENLNELQTRINSYSSGDVIQLANDLNFFNEGYAEMITVDNDVTIDLNGHSISYGNNMDAAIKVNGTLTLVDSAGGGAVTNNRTKYGGIWVKGTLNLNGGTITGNTASDHGGDVFDSGTFNLSADAQVGTVYLPKNRVVNVTGPLSSPVTVTTGDKEYPVTIAAGAEGMESYFLNGNEDTAEVVPDGTDVKLAIPYELTYDANAGEDAVEDFPNPATIKAYAGMKMPDVVPPTREGYTFKGFNAKKDGTGYAFYEADGIGKNRGAEGPLTIYAQWEKHKYLIQGKFMHGQTVNPGLMITEGQDQFWYTDSAKITRGPLGSAPTGYTYELWNAKEDLSGTAFEVGQTYTVKEILEAAGTTGYDSRGFYVITLYGKRIPKDYTVQFDSNAPENTEVTGEMEDQSFVYGESQELNANQYSAVGYAFAGWSADPDATTATYTDGQSVSDLTGEESITLYAVWAPIYYSVFLIRNGEEMTGRISNWPIVPQTPVEVIPEFNLNECAYPGDGYAAPGYEYDYWYTSEDCSGTRVEAGDYTVKDFITMLAGIGYPVDNVTYDEYSQEYRQDIILYSRIVNPIQYELNYDLDGGEYPEGVTNPSSSTVETENFKLNNPVKEGYAFEGWTINDDTTIHPSLTVYTASRQKYTFTAHWTTNKYKIFWESNYPEGSDAANMTVGPGSREFGVDWNLADPAQEGVEFECPGYEFVNWNTAPDGSGTSYEAGAPFEDIVENGAEVHFYAQWEPIGYSITVDEGIENGTITTDVPTANVGDTITLTIQPDTGYLFVSDSLIIQPEVELNPVEDAEGEYTFVMPASDVTISGEFEAKKTTIRFDKLNGGDVYGTSNISPKKTVAAFGQPLPEREVPSLSNYTFLGYFDAAEGGKQYYDGEGQPMEGITWDKEDPEVTLYAQWELTEYTITYNNAEAGDHNNPATFTVNDLPITLEDASREGNTFGGWFADEACEGEAVTTIETAEDTVLYAKWDAIKYDVTMHTGEGTFANGKKTHTRAIAYGDNYSFPSTDPSWDEEHEFAGWYDNEEFTGDPITTETPMLRAEDHDLYAKWTAIEYEIAYELDGGVNAEENPTSIAKGDTPFTLVDPSKEGYDFAGWYTTADFTGDPVTTIDPENLSAEEAFTLYAKWTAGEFLFTRMDGDKKLGATYYAFGAPIPGYKEPTKAGYTFTGWDPEIPETMPNKDLTVYAQWEANKYIVNFDPNAPEGTTAAGTMEPQEFTFGAAQALSKNQFTVEGYEFLGWQSASGKDNPEPKYTDEQEVTSLTSNPSTTLFAVWAKLYNVTVEPAFGAEVTFTPENPIKAGETVTAAVTAMSGFELKEDALTATPEVELTKGAGGTYTFTMPAEDVTLTANVQYQVKIAAAENGTVTVDEQKPEVGDTVKITAKADDGFEIDSVKVTDSNKKEVAITDNGNGEYTFVMPASNVKVTAVFTELPVPEVTAAPENNTVAFGYTEGSEFTADVTNKDEDRYNYTYQWYEVINGEEKAINEGGGEATFAPMGKDAGTYTYFCEVTAAKKDSGEQATGRSNEVTLTVETAIPEITFTPKQPVEYNGEDQEIMTVTVYPAASVVDIFEKDGKTIVIDDSNKDSGEYIVKAKNAGNYTIKVEIAKNEPNYKSAFDKADPVRIDQRIAEIKWSGVPGDETNFDFPYNGQPQGPTAVVENLAGDDTCTINIAGNQVTEVGNNYIAVAQGLSNPNYTLVDAANTSRPFTIVADDAVADISAAEDLVYNGEA